MKDFSKTFSVYFFIPILSLLFSSCAASKTVTRSQPALPISSEPVMTESEISAALENINPEEMEDYARHKGVVFAKTDFQGLLKTSYVRLKIESLDVPAESFYLHIGGGTPESGLPWEVKRVEPGYFFIELPSGKYRISSVAIPYGSTLATEDMNVEFVVEADAITYAGTLQLIGTKERIKLGGLPVIKPGFEFEQKVLDEKAEGLAVFNERYPNAADDINVRLMESFSVAAPVESVVEAPQP